MNKKEKKPHLGMGLEALLGPINDEFKAAVSEKTKKQEKTVELPEDKPLKDAINNVPIDSIQPNPFQPRKEWNEEELQELTDSIRANGVIQPILARKTGLNYQIIAGERRFRAAKNAGLTEIPALVRDATDEQMHELALVENIHRTDLNAIERAMAYQNYIKSFNLTQVEAAERLGENRSVVSNYLRLLDLPREIKNMLSQGLISMGHARAILALPTDELRKKLANRALAGRLSVREVEKIVRNTLQNKETEKTETPKAPHILDLESRLRDTLGTKVVIDAKKKGNRGKIIIEYYSLDEFDKLTERMGLSNRDDL